MKMPIDSIKNIVPTPMNNELANDNLISFNISRVNFVEVTSYTKNQAVKNSPITIRTKAN